VTSQRLGSKILEVLIELTHRNEKPFLRVYCLSLGIIWEERVAYITKSGLAGRFVYKLETLWGADRDLALISLVCME